MNEIDLAQRLRFLQVIKGLTDKELAWMRAAMQEEEDRRARRSLDEGQDEWTSS